MKKWAEWQKRIAPEAVRLIQERYGLLNELLYEGYKGRRVLAQRLGVSERTARHHLDFLKQAGLLETGATGASLTPDGEQALESLGSYVREFSGLSYLENSLAEHFSLSKVIVVAGDSWNNPDVLQDLGRAGAEELQRHLHPHTIVAVGGGSTLAQVAKGVHKKIVDVTVVPARGGLGETVEVQSNTIAAVLAGGLGGEYRMLHIPDGLNEKATQLLLEADPSMREVVELIPKADILVQGIGRSDQMAKRRNVTDKMSEKIRKTQAVGEAMGYYFDQSGKVVHETSSLGMKYHELSKVGYTLAVAGGSDKGEAILSVLKAGGQQALVTDEGAANRILNMIEVEK